ncbi:hypothetical protein WDU94_013310 [Cyamophila willieti]
MPARAAIPNVRGLCMLEPKLHDPIRHAMTEEDSQANYHQYSAPAYHSDVELDLQGNNLTVIFDADFEDLSSLRILFSSSPSFCSSYLSSYPSPSAFAVFNSSSSPFFPSSSFSFFSLFFSFSSSLLLLPPSPSPSPPPPPPPPISHPTSLPPSPLPPSPPHSLSSSSLSLLLPFLFLLLTPPPPPLLPSFSSSSLPPRPPFLLPLLSHPSVHLLLFLPLP